MEVAREGFPFRVKSSQSALCPVGEPEDALAVNKNGLEVVGGEEMWVVRVVVVGDDILPVATMQPTLRSEPEKAGAVLHDVLYAITKETAGQGEDFKTGVEVFEIGGRLLGSELDGEGNEEGKQGGIFHSAKFCQM